MLRGGVGDADGAVLTGEQAMIVIMTERWFRHDVRRIGEPDFYSRSCKVGAGKTATVPPFVVQIAWNQMGSIYAVFGAMFIIAVGVLIVLLIRMKVFEAVKLGESISEIGKVERAECGIVSRPVA
jgi:putative ABC transport system permease protein